MKQAFIFSKSLLQLAALLMCAASAFPAMAQVYRCGGSNGITPEYINNAKEAQVRGCKAMQGGNVTIMQAAPGSRSPVRVASASPASARNDGGTDQKARDGDSRNILASELKKAEAKLAEQQKEYNNGEPEKQGIEGRNYQRYVERVSDLKDSIARNQSDIEGLKRELSRLPTSN